MVEREEVGGEGFKEEAFVAEPDALSEVKVVVVEVATDDIHHVLEVLSDETSQEARVQGAWRGEEVALNAGRGGEGGRKGGRAGLPPTEEGGREGGREERDVGLASVTGPSSKTGPGMFHHVR